MVELRFTVDILDAVVREGADQLTLRRGEQGTQRTLSNNTNVGDNRLETAAGEQGLARHLPGHPQRHRRS